MGQCVWALRLMFLPSMLLPFPYGQHEKLYPRSRLSALCLENRVYQENLMNPSPAIPVCVILVVACVSLLSAQAPVGDSGGDAVAKKRCVMEWPIFP